MDPRQTSCYSNDLHLPSAERSMSAAMSSPSEESKTDNDGRPVLSDGWQINLPLGHCMLKMFDEQLWTDVAFRCADQSEENLDDRIRAHKIVLAARSPVFQAMFFGPWQDNNAEVAIRDTGSNEFKMFIRLLYSDACDVHDSYEDLVDILSIAHKYQVQVIVNKCCRQLVKLIRYDNACALLEKAFLYESRYLIKTVSNFIDRNAEKVLMTGGFLEMSLPCLTYILKGDTFHANESDIFNRVIEWAKQRCENTDGRALRQTLGEAFYYLRTPCMAVAEFTACTKRKGYYSMDEFEDIMDIFGCTEKAKKEIECNSTCKRVPFDIVVKSPETEGHDMTTGTMLYDNITIKPKVHVYLNSLELNEFTKAKLNQSTWLHKNINRRIDGIRREILLDETVHMSNDVSIRDMIFSVNIKLGYYQEENFEIISGSGPSTIEMRNPFLLSPGISYDLYVTVKLKALALNDKLEFEFPRRGNKVVFIGTSSEILSVETKETHLRSPQVIRHLAFKGISKRNINLS